MAIKKIDYLRKPSTLLILFGVFYILLITIHLVASNNLNYVEDSRFRESTDVNRGIHLENGAYYLVFDNTGLTGPLGKGIPIQFSSINIKGEIRSFDRLYATTFNESISLNEIVKIRFLISGKDQWGQNVQLIFESTDEISGAIYHENEIDNFETSRSNFEKGETISNFRLIPLIGMIIILIYGTYLFVIRLGEADYNLKKLILGLSIMKTTKNANPKENSNVKASTTFEPPEPAKEPDELKLSRKEKKEIEKKAKEEAKLIAAEEAETKRKQKLEREIRERIEKFQKIVMRSAKLKIEQLANMLRMDQTDLLDWLYELPKEFGFIINDEMIEFDTVKIGDSIDKLLAGFESAEETKEGKSD